MRKLFLLVAVAALVALIAGAFFWLAPTTPATEFGFVAQSDPDPSNNIWTDGWGIVPSNQLIVVGDGRPSMAIDVALALEGGLMIGSIEYLGLYQFRFEGANEADLRAAIAAAKAVPGVEDAFPNPLVEVQAQTQTACPSLLSDPVYADGRGKPYEMIGVERAWHLLRLLDADMARVRIGVMDTALMTKDPQERLNNEFETARLIQQEQDRATDYPIDSAGAVQNDGFHHANGVLGLIAADHGDGGISGIASPLGRRLEVVHTDIFRAGEQTPDATAESPAYATLESGGTQTYMLRTLVDMMRQIEQGATIINGSFGPLIAGEDNAGVARMYSRFYERMADEHPEVLFVFAAGNEGAALTGTNSFPGGTPHPNVITVGNLMNDGSVATSSNIQGEGGEVTLGAPGQQSVWGQGLTGVQNDNGGTSSAAPMVTAAAALMRAVNPDLSAGEIKDILTTTADAGPTSLGGRTLRVDRAVLAAYNRAQETDNTFLDFLLDSSTPTLTMEDVDRLCVGESLDDVLRDATGREDATAQPASTTPAPSANTSAPTVSTTPASAPTVTTAPAPPPPAPAKTYAVWEGTNASVGVNVTTTDQYEREELASGYSGGGVSGTLMLEKQLLSGGFASQDAAMGWICSQLDNIRYAKFAGRVADYQGRRVLLGNVRCE